MIGHRHICSAHLTVRKYCSLTGSCIPSNFITITSKTKHCILEDYNTSKIVLITWKALGGAKLKAKIYFLCTETLSLERTSERDRTVSLHTSSAIWSLRVYDYQVSWNFRKHCWWLEETLGSDYRGMTKALNIFRDSVSGRASLNLNKCSSSLHPMKKTFTSC